MKYISKINIIPLKELLDPQGKAVNNSLHNLGLIQVTDVRIGKHITLSLEATSKEIAEKITAEACRKLLANAVMESYNFEVEEVN